jgi:hypothetical protein
MDWYKPKLVSKCNFLCTLTCHILSEDKYTKLWKKLLGHGQKNSSQTFLWSYTLRATLNLFLYTRTVCWIGAGEVGETLSSSMERLEHNRPEGNPRTRVGTLQRNNLSGRETERLSSLINAHAERVARCITRQPTCIGGCIAIERYNFRIPVRDRLKFSDTSLNPSRRMHQYELPHPVLIFFIHYQPN